LFGWAGGVEDAERMKRAIIKGTEPPKDMDLTCLLIERDGSVHLWERALWVKQKDTYFARLPDGVRVIIECTALA
jgi:hypothetical protein